MSQAQPLPAAAQATPKPLTLKPYTHIVAAFLCGMFAFIDLYCTQPLLPLLSHVFQASEASVSLTISASTLGVAISAALLALLAERVNRKRTIVASMLALGVCTLLTATAQSLTALAVWRFLEGLVTPGIFIITIAYVTEEWPALLVPRVMSFYVAGTVFGGFLGRVSGGVLAEHLGWRAPFIALGLLGITGAAVTWKLLPTARFRSPAAAPTTAAQLFRPVLTNIRNPRLIATFGIGFCMLFTLVSVFSYITFYLAAPPFTLSTSELSWLFSVYLVGLFATLAAGTILARIGLRHGMLAACALSFTGVTITLIPSLVAVAVGLALCGSGVFIAQTCANSFLRDAAAPGTRVSAAGLYICFYYVGGTVGGLLPAVVWRHYAWPGCAALTCAFLVLAAVLTFFGWRTARRPDPIPL